VKLLLKFPHLQIFPATVEKRGSGYFYVKTKCLLCGAERDKEIRNMEKGFSSKCQCQNPQRSRVKYPGRDPQVITSLTRRFAAMRQRCETDTHVSSHRYLGRGIKVEFKDKEDFIAWALEKYSDAEIAELDFDREENDGNYSRENLRLATRSVNLFNREYSQRLNCKVAKEFLKQHPEVRYTWKTVLGLMKMGVSNDEILTRHAQSIVAGRRKHTTS
jgi:hypothetical protein